MLNTHCVGLYLKETSHPSLPQDTLKGKNNAAWFRDEDDWGLRELNSLLKRVWFSTGRAVI